MKRSYSKAALLARIASEKKAEEILVLKLKNTFIVDYLVICTATTSIHAHTIADAIRQCAKEKKILHHVEGYPEGGWVLVDCDEVMVHIFLPEKREFYRLEELFFDAKKVKIRGL